MRPPFALLLLASAALAPTAFASFPGSLGSDASERASVDGASLGRAGLAAAHADARHAARVQDDGSLVARSHAQGYATHFDGRRAAVQGEGWSFELALAGFGRTDAWIDATTPTGFAHDGRRVEYRWDAGLTEWFVNRDGGLEHGFDLATRPKGEGELCVELEITTELDTRLAANARTLEFVDANGAVATRYAGLVAFDSRGTDLDARFVLDGELLRVLVDDTGAVYPLTIDPVVKTAYLKAFDSDAFDDFGIAVAIWGSTAVVGAPGEDGAGGIGSNPASNGLQNCGAAYVFRRTASGWEEEAYLKAPSRTSEDRFGVAVDIHKNRIVVGCTSDDSNASLVDGNSSDNSLTNAGAAWVFVRSGTTWSVEAYLKANAPDSFDGFGGSVAIDGDVIVVGASQEESASTGVNGNANDDSAANSGAAYVYRRVTSGWVFDAYLKASNTDAGDWFGRRVAISGDTIAVSATQERSNAIGVGGGQSDDSLTFAGAVYVFVDTGSGWSQQAYVKATNTDQGDLFGYGLDLDGDTLVVGAIGEDSAATNVGGLQSDDSLNSSGAAYVYERAGTNWFATAYLKSAEPDSSDQFGYSVAVSGGTIAVGAEGEEGGDTGDDGDPFDDSAPGAGAAFLFKRQGLTWAPHAYLKASNTDDGDGFGNALALDGESLIVGAWGEDSDGDGIGSSEVNDFASSAGAAYTFDVGYWDPIPGCFVNPAIILPPARSAYLGETFRFTVQATTITSGVAASFWGASGLDASGCGVLIGLGQEVLLATAPFPKLISVELVNGGTADETFPIPDVASLAGARVAIQSVVVDTVTFASEFSQGLEIEVRP